MGKLIDAEVIVNFLEEEKNNWEGQNPYNRGRSDSLQWIIDRIKSNNSRIGIIDSIPSPTIKPGDEAKHPDLGQVRIMDDPVIHVLKGENTYEVYLSDLEQALSTTEPTGAQKVYNWVPATISPAEGRYIITDGWQIGQGGYYNGQWYADDLAPLMSEDITHYMIIQPPDINAPESTGAERVKEFCDLLRKSGKAYGADWIEHAFDLAGITIPSPTIKPGNKVKIISALAREWIGREAVVTEVYTEPFLHFSLDIGGGHWTPSCLEVIESD